LRGGSRGGHGGRVAGEHRRSHVRDLAAHVVDDAPEAEFQGGHEHRRVTRHGADRDGKLVEDMFKIVMQRRHCLELLCGGGSVPYDFPHR
jgi:hypothetical protein